MTPQQERYLTEKVLAVRARLVLAIAVVLLFLHTALWWLSDGWVDAGKVLFYTQQFQDYLFWPQCLAFWLVPLAIPIAIKIGVWQLRSWRFGLATVAVVMLFVACVGSHYILFFANTLDHVGTIRLGNNVYQLARIFEYDADTIYYLGECDASGYWCRFHEIYRVYLFGDNSATFQVSADQYLVVTISGNEIYTYDGIRENCVDPDNGKCANKGQ